MDVYYDDDLRYVSVGGKVRFRVNGDRGELAMKKPKPDTSKAVSDGIYLGMVHAAEDAVSQRNPNAKQIKFSITLNTRETTSVWVNWSAKGLEALYAVGLARDLPSGDVEVIESDYLVGVIVTNGRGVFVPATKVVSMNPSLKPLFGQVAQRAGYK